VEFCPLFSGVKSPRSGNPPRCSEVPGARSPDLRGMAVLFRRPWLSGERRRSAGLRCVGLPVGRGLARTAMCDLPGGERLCATSPEGRGCRPGESVTPVARVTTGVGSSRERDRPRGDAPTGPENPLRQGRMWQQRSDPRATCDRPRGDELAFHALTTFSVRFIPVSMSLTREKVLLTHEKRYQCGVRCRWG
jgi:hypothetical protein